MKMWEQLAIIFVATLVHRVEHTLASSPSNLHSYGSKPKTETSEKSSAFRSNYRCGSLTNQTPRIESPNDITCSQSELVGSRMDKIESHDAYSTEISEIDLISAQEGPKKSAPAQPYLSLGHRHTTRMDKRAILGRAVLTTPHRRMPAARIALGHRASLSCKLHFQSY